MHREFAIDYLLILATKSEDISVSAWWRSEEIFYRRRFVGPACSLLSISKRVVYSKD